jgi:polyferredoxin
MAVQGFFRKFKWYVLFALLGLYYILPWIRWDRGPNAPNQAVLLDIPERRFYFFFIEIWPQEIYFLAGLLIFAAFGLFLVTSLLGRVWCGFACPQTVWTDLFVWVERRIEGDRNARMKLDKQPWSADKVAKKVAKHAVWLVIALATGGAWIMYFKNAPTAVYEFFTLQGGAAFYGFTGLFTATTYVLAGWAREQVCVYMCPWPRFQAAMLDEDSMIVTYEAWRGEPRGKPKKQKRHVSPAELPPQPQQTQFQNQPGLANMDWERADALYGQDRLDNLGDCIDCNKCVAVCPTGIDIRDGVQMECIGCGLCIDACNEVMDKLGRPRGLITYDTLRNQQRRAQGLPARIQLLRPRTILYGLLMLVIAGAMLWALAFRATMDITVLHDRNPLFVTLSDGSIKNGYTVKLLNKTREPRSFTLDMAGVRGASLSVVGEDTGGAQATLTAEPDSVATYKLYVTAPDSAVQGARTAMTFTLTDQAGRSVTHETFFRGPGG